MPITTLALAPLLALQSAGENIVAIPNDAPETWTVEYPRVVTPFVEDYRRCLHSANRRLSGKPDFELQYSADFVRCEETSAKAQAQANTVLEKRGGSEEFAPADIQQVFDHIGRIHIARGADLDRQFNIVLVEGAKRRDEYRQRQGGWLVMELRDGSVVKAAADQSSEGKIQNAVN